MAYMSQERSIREHRNPQRSNQPVVKESAMKNPLNSRSDTNQSIQ